MTIGGGMDVADRSRAWMLAVRWTALEQGPFSKAGW